MISFGIPYPLFQQSYSAHSWEPGPDDQSRPPTIAPPITHAKKSRNPKTVCISVSRGNITLSKTPTNNPTTPPPTAKRGGPIVERGVTSANSAPHLSHISPDAPEFPHGQSKNGGFR